MQDYYLKFQDEAEAMGALYAGETPRFQNIDVIGTIYRPTGETQQTEDGVVPAMVAIPGWHVNVRATPDEDASDLEPYRVNPEPTTPVRVWS